MTCLIAKGNSNQPNPHERIFCYCDMEHKDYEIKALEEKLKVAVEALEDLRNDYCFGNAHVYIDIDIALEKIKAK